MMQVALNDTSLVPSLGADPSSGPALTGLVRQYNTANAIIMRPTRAIDSAENAERSALMQVCQVAIKVGAPEQQIRKA